MKQVALDVVKKLKLNYAVTLISRGETGRCEIVMWDRSRDSYFSVRLRWCAETSVENLAREIETQLRQRLAVLSGRVPGDLADRRPTRSSHRLSARTEQP